MLMPQLLALGPEINTTLNTYAQATTSKPGYLATAFDSVYSTRIMRVTGDPGNAVSGVSGQTWQNHECHHYSLDNAWNADGSILYLEERCSNNVCGSGTFVVPLYIDGNTFAPLYQLGSELGGDRRIWHPTNKNLQLYVNGNTIDSFDVSNSGAITTLATITGYSGFSLGPYKGITTNDGNAMAILATRTSDTHSVVFSYNTHTATKGTDIDLTSAGISIGPGIGGECQISPLGTYIFITDTSDNITVYNASTGALLRTWLAGANATGRPSHGDCTVDANGDEVLVGTDKNNGVNNGIVIKRRFSDGAITNLTSNGYSSHHSCRNINRPNWAYVTYQDVSSSYPPFNTDTEIIAVKLDGSGDIERYVQMRNAIGTDVYYNEPHGSVSADGNKIIWKSNWGAATGPMQAYVALISR